MHNNETNSAEVFFGNQHSTTGKWIREQYKSTPLAVEELATLAQMNNYKTIGELITDKKKAVFIIQPFLKSGCIMKTLENIETMSVDDLKTQFQYAFRFRNDQLLNLTKKPVIVEEKMVEVKTDVTQPIISSEVELTRFEQDQLRYDALPKQFREAAEYFTFSEHKVVHGAVLLNQESKTIRLNTRLMY